MGITFVDQTCKTKSQVPERQKLSFGNSWGIPKFADYDSVWLSVYICPHPKLKHKEPYNVSQMSEQSYWANGLLCCQKLVLHFKAASYMFYVSLGTLYRYQGCIKYSLCCLGNVIHVPQHKTPFARYNCEPLCSSNFGDFRASKNVYILIIFGLPYTLAHSLSPHQQE